MKRFVAAFVAGIMMFAVASCGTASVETTDDETTDDETAEKTTVSEETETTVNETTETEEVTWVREGDYIILGHYEQDGDLDNGPEPIEWEIVKEEDGRILLVSRYILDCKPYNTERTGVTWETCSLRSWLNDDFFNTAFDETDQDQILTVTNTNPDNMTRGTDGGNDTDDKVFVLSVNEILDNYEFEEWDETSCIGSSQALMTEVTQYAQDQGAVVADNGCGDWWLRTPGNMSECVAMVFNHGRVVSDGFLVDSGISVRPAIYVKR